MAILSFINSILFILVSVLLIREDYRNHRLPNRYVVPLLVSTLTISIVDSVQEKSPTSLFISVGIPCFVFAIFFAVSLIFPAGLGMGDVKVILLIGLILSGKTPTLFYISLSVSFIAGFFYALSSKISRRQNGEIPFGPFLLIPAIALTLATTLS